jgi:ribosomal protein L12E/L44/L45/RPP1/RPP2
VEPFWPSLFAKALEGVDVKSLITNVGAGAGAAPAGAAPAAAAPAAAAGGKKEEKKEEKKKEEKKEESDGDMGFGKSDRPRALVVHPSLPSTVQRPLLKFTCSPLFFRSVRLDNTSHPSVSLWVLNNSVKTFDLPASPSERGALTSSYTHTFFKQCRGGCETDPW